MALKSVINEQIVSITPVGGGSIARSGIAETESGKRFFIKSYGKNKKILQNEVNGLNELRKGKEIKIPQVIAVTDEHLVLEFIETGKRKNNFSELFGVKLARLHKIKSDKFGFYENNFIGYTPQINLPENNNWLEFYWENRLLYQFKLAENNGYADAVLRKLFLKLEKQLTEIIGGTEEMPALLHGDLWSGNYMVDVKGNPVLIDPAVYYGHREAELGMTKLFGGFDPVFYEAYNNEYPLLPEWEYRIDFYMLYHVLNHLNLFGYTYYSQVVSIIKKYVT